MERTITGKIKVLPRKKVSHNGNPYVELLILTKDQKHYQCLLFRESGERAIKELKEAFDTEVVVFGKVEQRGDDPDHWKILGSTWGYANPEKQGDASKRIGDKESPGEQYVAMMKRNGLVRAIVDEHTLGWVKEKDCVLIKDKFMDKLTFILAMLGPDVVNRVLKENGVGVFENLKHWEQLKADLLGCAITDYKAGKGLWKKHE